MITPEYSQLQLELAEAGVPTQLTRSIRGAQLTLTSPVDVLVNSGISTLPYEKILLKFAPYLRGGELEMVVRALGERGMKAAGLYLVSLFDDLQLSESESFFWVVSSALHMIHDKRTYPKVLAIAAQSRFGAARQPLMGLLAEIRTDEAYEVLMACLNEDEIRGHAIEALGRFGRIDAIPALEAIQTDKRKYEHRASKQRSAGSPDCVTGLANSGLQRTSGLAAQVR